MRRTAHGFTLVELLIVVAIVGVLAAVAGYGFAKQGRALGSSSFARGLHFACMRARADAVADGIQRQLSCTSSKCSVLKATTPGLGVPAGTPLAMGLDSETIVAGGTTAMVYWFDALPRVGNWTVGAGPISGTQTVTFFPDGTSTGGTFFVSDRDQRTLYKVYVFRGTGMSRLVSNW